MKKATDSHDRDHEKRVDAGEGNGTVEEGLRNKRQPRLKVVDTLNDTYIDILVSIPQEPEVASFPAGPTYYQRSKR
jgi:hypothetical protein